MKRHFISWVLASGLLLSCASTEPSTEITVGTFNYTTSQVQLVNGIAYYFQEVRPPEVLPPLRPESYKREGDTYTFFLTQPYFAYKVDIVGRGAENGRLYVIVDKEYRIGYTYPMVIEIFKLNEWVRLSTPILEY